MYKLLCLLLSAGMFAGSVYAQGVLPTPSNPSTTIDMAIMPANPLHQILDSLRERPVLKGLKIKLRDINFKTNSYDLTAESATYLDTVASVLNKFPALQLEIGGHTDNVGTDHDNLILSANRARAVRNQLVSNGNVAAKRLTYRGYGEQKPVAPNTTDAYRLLNRRVEMQFIGLDDQQVSKIQLRNGQIIEAALVYVNEQNQTVLYKISENSPLLELSCLTVEKIVFADNRIQVMECAAPTKSTEPEPLTVPVTVKRAHSYYIQLHGGSGYMIGQRPAWTSKTAGYAHVLGFGGNLSVGYRLSRSINVGIETGYWRWSTRVDYLADRDRSLLSQYYSEATQIPVSLIVPIYINNHVYLTPEGGVNFLKIKAGFDGDRITSTHVQTHYGGTLGYTTNRNKPVWFDIGLFFRSYQGMTRGDQGSVPPMNYAGLTFGLGFSL